MEGITLGQIAAWVAFTAALLTGLGVIAKKVGKAATTWLQSQLAPINTKLDKLNINITDVDVAQCKNFLVRFLADVEQGNNIYEVEKERFYEIYERYRNLGGNSYIHDKVEKLKKEGKL